MILKTIGVRNRTIIPNQFEGRLPLSESGFWDAEGSVRKQDNYFHVYLYNSDIKLLETMGGFLNTRKIDYSKLQIDGSKRGVYNIRGRPIRAKKIIHRLSIPKSSLLKWAKEIGIHMFHSKKKKVVEEIFRSFKEVF